MMSCEKSIFMTGRRPVRVQTQLESHPSDESESTFVDATLTVVDAVVPWFVIPQLLSSVKALLSQVATTLFRMLE